MRVCKLEFRLVFEALQAQATKGTARGRMAFSVIVPGTLFRR